MNTYKIDQEAKRLLLSGQEIDPAASEEVRQRILDIAFDCTPNWGIRGFKVSDNHAKTSRNWYTSDDEEVRIRAAIRQQNIDEEALRITIQQAVSDIVGSSARVAGFGIYGSYLYREVDQPPEDLDVLVLVDDVTGVALDALRYRVSNIRNNLIDEKLFSPQTNDLGLTIISKDQFNPYNQSMIITDAALLDVSTTYSYGVQVDAPTPPPFVIIHNAEKLVGWGLSSLGSKQTSTASRFNEALRMRALVAATSPHLGLEEFQLQDYLPSAEELLRGISTTSLLELSKVVSNLLKLDEQRIREYAAGIR